MNSIIKGYHRTQSGEYIPIRELTNKHLANILKWHHRRAQEGVPWTFTTRDEWSPEYTDVAFGEDALRVFNHDDFVREAKKRGIKACECTRRQACR